MKKQTIRYMAVVSSETVEVAADYLTWHRQSCAALGRV